jgi:hypothetical protein
MVSTRQMGLQNQSQLQLCNWTAPLTCAPPTDPGVIADSMSAAPAGHSLTAPASSGSHAWLQQR